MNTGERKRQNINVLQHIKTNVLNNKTWELKTDESGFSENPKTQFSTGMVWVLTSKELIFQTFTSSKSGVKSTKDVPSATKGSRPVFHKTCLGMDPDAPLNIPKTSRTNQNDDGKVL